MLYEITFALTLATGYWQSPDGAACSHLRTVLSQGGKALQVAQYSPLRLVNVPPGTYSIATYCVDLGGRTVGPVVESKMAVPPNGVPHLATNGALTIKYTVQAQVAGQYWPTPVK